MSVPGGLGVGGAALWASLGCEVGTAEGRMALEACRAADRLDELDSIIHGEGVVELMRFRVPNVFEVGDESVTVEVKFDAVLAEARQQQNNLRQLLVSLTGMTGSSAGKQAVVEVSTPLDELTKRRSARGAGASRKGRAKVAGK